MANLFWIAGENSKYQQKGGKRAGFFAGIWHGVMAPVTIMIQFAGYYAPLLSGVSFYELHHKRIRYNVGFILAVAWLYGPFVVEGFSVIVIIALGLFVLLGLNLVGKEQMFRRQNQQLEETNTALSAANHELFDKNRALEQASEQIQAQSAQIQEADRLKSEFLARMSHELRTPMNAIVGFSKLVLRKSGKTLEKRQQENLEKVVQSANLLLQLISDILDLSKIEAGRIDIVKQYFSVDELVKNCLNTTVPLLKPGVELSTPGITDARFYSDPDRLRQILANLLSNAAKFTEVGTITVSAQCDDCQLVVAVRDTGIGIPEKALETIFDEFRQAEESTTRKYGGTGLGLSISRQLARLLGGDITVQSKMESGSEFRVAIPAATGTDPKEVIESTVGVPIEGKHRILAIDDDPDVLSLLSQEMQDEGYSVIGVTNPQEGIRKARELKPHVVTVDIRMPEMSGWEVITELKSDRATRDIPIVVVSIVDNKQMGFRLGADEYLVKPFDKDTLLRVIQSFSAQGREILVVDDDLVVIDIVRQELEDDGWKVRGATNGMEALSAVAQKVPDVLLLDLLMPEMDGFETLRRLREQETTQDLPIIVITAKNLSPDEREELEQHTLRVIEKNGLGRDRLLAELRQVLNVACPGSVGRE